jgi:predicted AAA+ superfamily ATPase
MEFNNLEIDWEYLLERIERFLDLGDEYLTRKLIDYQPDPQLFQQHLAFRWIKSYHTGYFEAVTFPDLQDHASLMGMDDILDRLSENTAQFVYGLPCNNILLRGEPGNGKRSAIKGLLKKFADKGLRLIQINSRDLHQLPSITSCLRNLPFYFILLCCDLFHSTTTENHKELANWLQGGIETRAKNVLLYATSNCATPSSAYANDSHSSNPANRRNKAVEESLAEAGFGIIINMSPMQKTIYLAICRHLLQQHALSPGEDSWQASALAWAEQRKGYCGLMARQFTDDLAGQTILRQILTKKST